MCGYFLVQIIKKFSVLLLFYLDLPATEKIARLFWTFGFKKEQELCLLAGKKLPEEGGGVDRESLTSVAKFEVFLCARVTEVSTKGRDRFYLP